MSIFKGCINCKHSTRSKELNLNNKNCADCLTKGNYVGYEPLTHKNKKFNYDKLIIILLSLILGISILNLFILIKYFI